MPLDNIKKRILAEAETQAEAVKKEADAEVHRIKAESEVRAKQIELEAQNEASSESRRLIKENDAGLEIEANAILLEAKGSAIERATQLVVNETESILEDKYLADMLKSGISQFKASSGEEPIVMTSRENAKLVQSLGIQARQAEIGGFVIESKDGKMRLEVSADSLISSNMDGIRGIVSEMLFGRPEKKADPGMTEEEML